jgi:methyl-accepting chemotaxis protein
MNQQQNIAARLQFHCIDTATRDTLRASREYLLPLLPGILDRFYTHVLKTPQTARRFTSDAHVQHAKAMQLRHWGLLFQGRFEDEYVAAVTRVGEAHYKINLEPQWYIGAYDFLLGELLEAIGPKRGWTLFRRHHGDTATLQKAVTKAIMLDMDYAIAVYLEAGKRDRALIDRLGGTLRDSVGAIVTSLSTAATDMHTAAEELTQSAETTMGRVGAVATATERTSGNIYAVATATEAVAEAISEISRQVKTASAVTAKAVAISGDAVAKMEKLSEASEQIRAVLDLINRIAGQTNLLALNATIEAARAGEAGRGFAVVAQEVKMLARQTSGATVEIGAQIDDVRGLIAETAGGIGAIAEVVRQINGISDAIASSMHKQDAATKQIATTIQQISHGTAEVSESMSDVNRAAETTGSGASHVLSSARDLATQAGRLHRDVLDFLSQVAAA